MTKKEILKKLGNIIAVIITILLILFIVYAIRTSSLTNKEYLVLKIKSYGAWGPLVFLIIHLIQIMFPLIPGGVTLVAGVLTFGPVLGFIYNYIGIIIGSTISFLLARKIGLPIINYLFKKETVSKYLDYINKEKFEKIFILAILLPFFPDDLLCFIAGNSNMRLRKFLLILLIGKPVTLIFYSIFINIF